VKITGAVNPPLTNIESVCDDLLQVVPDSCLSSTEKKTMPFPETCPSLVVGGGPSSVAADAEAVTDGSVQGGTTDDDSDLGDFLADAVSWL
jgi:hypothetical protein